jgi:hypothetical protein
MDKDNLCAECGRVEPEHDSKCGSSSMTDGREQAWYEWWIKWPSSIAKKELQQAFYAGYDAALIGTHSR